MARGRDKGLPLFDRLEPDVPPDPADRPGPGADDGERPGSGSPGGGRSRARAPAGRSRSGAGARGAARTGARTRGAAPAAARYGSGELEFDPVALGDEAVARDGDSPAASAPAATSAGRSARASRGASGAAPPIEPAEARPALGKRDAPLSVSAAVKAANRALERQLGALWVEGEVRQISRSGRGHIYFDLVDSSGGLSAVMWASDARRLRFRLDEGQRVLCRGSLGIYERTGRFQMYVRLVEPAGAGAEALALEQLKQRLAAEGLFDPARKRPLPALPRRIGVVTSRTGAAVRDIIRVVQRRFPVPLLLAPAVVQGDAAPVSIAGAVGALGAHDVDVIIVGRGGGSASDLAAFNDERVVRAVAACPVPTISAVGHEVDTSLTDLVADRRAATPSQAGELVVPVLADLSAALRKEEQRLDREMALRLRTARQDLDRGEQALVARMEVARSFARRSLAELEGRLAAHHPRARVAGDRAAVRELERRLARVPGARLASARADLGDLERRLSAHHPAARVSAGRAELRALERRATDAARRACEGRARELGTLTGRLDAMSPLRVLERGFALATRDGRVVTEAAAVDEGDTLEIRLARGRLEATVKRRLDDE